MVKLLSSAMTRLRKTGRKSYLPRFPLMSPSCSFFFFLVFRLSSRCWHQELWGSIRLAKYCISWSIQGLVPTIYCSPNRLYFCFYFLLHFTVVERKHLGTTYKVSQNTILINFFNFFVQLWCRQDADSL